MADLPYFVGRIVPAFMSYAPDADRLAALSDRLVLACGNDSRGELPYCPAALPAERFGRAVSFSRSGMWTALVTLRRVHLGWFPQLVRPVRQAGCVVRGNPVGIRDCPAAVSGNDRRHTHWDRTTVLGSDGQ